MRPALPALALAAALSSPAAAAFEDLGAGARAPGLGNAFTALADDVYAVHYNPAGLAQLERPQFSASFARLHMGLSDGSELGLSQFAYGHPLRKGRWGTLGTAWEQFALDDTYSERTLYLSWGKQVLERASGSKLMAGVSMKQLSHSFKPLPEAFNAKDKLIATGRRDPVLSGTAEASALDADVGFIYRFPRNWRLGFMAQHVMAPNVGFSGEDKVPMSLRFGAAYKSLWMNLSSDVRMTPAPGGGSDKDVILAAERYLPSLDLGQFGLRGSLGLGSRQWKQMTAGLSYRINKIQVDYGFQLPIGSVSGTVGTHRMSLTYHFGAPTAEEELSQDLLRQAQRFQEGKDPGYGYEFIDALRPRDLDDAALKSVRVLVEEGQFRKAHLALVELAKELPPDEGLVRLSNRLGLAAYYYPELVAGPDRWEIALSSSLQAFVRARDHESTLFGSYAVSLNPAEPKMGHFFGKLEEGTGKKLDRLPEDSRRGYIDELLNRVEAANNRGEQGKAVAVLGDILLLGPQDARALARVGSNFFILGRNEEAVRAWKRALALETDPRERRNLTEFIARVEGAASPAAGAPAPPSVPGAAPAPQAGPAKAPAGKASPQDIERMYQQGVEHYMRGERLQATGMFLWILQVDPDNARAKKALDRLRDKR